MPRSSLGHLRRVQARLERERLEHEVLDRSNLVLALQARAPPAACVQPAAAPKAKQSCTVQPIACADRRRSTLRFV